MKRPQPIASLRNWVVAGNPPAKGHGHILRVAPTSDGYGGSDSRRVPTLRADDQGYSLAYKAISDVFACVNLRAESIAEIPLKVVRTGTEIEIAKNPWVDAINDALDNGHQDLMYLIEYGLSIWGESYVLKLLQDDERTPGGLQWLNPQSVELIIENGYLIEFEYTGGDGDTKTFGRKQIGYYYYRDSDDDNIALSVIRAALDAANIKRNSQAFIEAFFANDATVGGIITGRSKSAAFGGSLAPLTEKDRDQIIRQWKEQNQGARKSFRTVMLPWDLDYERIGGEPPTAQIELNDDQRRNIHQVFRVPMSMTQASDASDPLSSGSTISKDEAKFWSGWVVPEHKRLVRFLNASVMPWLAPGMTLSGDYSEILQLISDTAERRDMWRNDVNAGLMTVNEYRSKTGEEPLDDGEVLYISSGAVVTPVDQLGRLTPEEIIDAEIVPSQPLLSTTIAKSNKMEMGVGGDCIMGFISDTGDIQRIQDTLRAAIGDDAEWTEPDNFHITMIYTNNPMGDEIRNQMPFDSVMAFPVLIDAIEVFDTSDGYAVHLRVRQGGMLSSVQGVMWDALGPMRDDFDPSEFSPPGNYHPHITLCYSKEPFESVVPITPFSVIVDSIQLTNGDRDVIRDVALKSNAIPTEPTESRALILNEYKEWRNFVSKRIQSGKTKFRLFKYNYIPDIWADETQKRLLDCKFDIDEIDRIFAEAMLAYKSAQSRRLNFENAFEDWMKAVASGKLTGQRATNALVNLWSVQGRLMFSEGLIDGGVMDGVPDEAEKKKIQELINQQRPFIRRLRTELAAGNVSQTQMEGKIQSWGNQFKSFWDEGLTSANKNQMLELSGDDGDESCRTCRTLKGQVHRAIVWAARQLRPGIDHHNYECGTYENCHHILVPVKAKAKGTLPSAGQISSWAAKSCDHEHTHDLPALDQQPYTMEQYDQYYATNGYEVETITHA